MLGTVRQASSRAPMNGRHLSPLWYRVNVKTPASTSMIDEQPKRRASTTGTLVGIRFQAPLLDAIDSWRKAQDDLPTRPEAVRRLVELGMTLKRAGVQMEHHAKPSNKNI